MAQENVAPRDFPKALDVATVDASVPAPTMESLPSAPADKAEAAIAPPTSNDVTGTIQPSPAEPMSPAPVAAPPETPRQADSPATPASAPVTQDASLPPLNLALKAALDARTAAPFKGGHAAETRKAREGVMAFYAARNYAPLWVVAEKWNEAAVAAQARLDRAAEDGLDLRAFAVQRPKSATADDLAAADIALSDAVVAYGRQASGSRVEPRAISPLIGSKPDVADPAAILDKVAGAGANAGDILAGFNPPQSGYKALRNKLAELRQAHAAPMARAPIPAGPDLKIGMRDPRMPLIRARFGLDGQPVTAPEDMLYDTKVAAAVADFQKANGLPGAGTLTARTVAALSGGQPSRLEAEIVANMERWRWMPRDLGQRRIEVNLPDFTVAVVKDDVVEQVHKVVIGKPETPTPVFSNNMQFLIVNPYWNVPQSIVKKEMLPKLGQDPDYLRRLGYEVISKNGQFIVRQPPGEKNALGRIKFMFPNDYAVYLHDTPSRSLFGSARRAFSHGCVRVDQPFGFAETVLGRDNGWSEARVKGLMGGKERYVYLPKPLPIHIEYFTAFVDATGRLQLRDDVYGYSHRVRLALGLEG